MASSPEQTAINSLWNDLRLLFSASNQKKAGNEWATNIKKKFNSISSSWFGTAKTEPEDKLLSETYHKSPWNKDSMEIYKQFAKSYAEIKKFMKLKSTFESSVREGLNPPANLDSLRKNFQELKDASYHIHRCLNLLEHNRKVWKLDDYREREWKSEPLVIVIAIQTVSFWILSFFDKNYSFC